MENIIVEENQEFKMSPEQKAEIDDIKRVIYTTIIEFHNYEFPKYIGNYKKYLGFVGDRAANIENWQSNVDYPLVASVVDTMFGNIFDFGYEFGINEPKLKELCTNSFDFRGIGKRTFKEVAKEILICGKGYVKDYLLKEETEEEFFGRKVVTKIKKPSMYYLSIFDVMYDRNKGLTDSTYKIIRTFQTGDAIKSKVLPLLMANETDEAAMEDVKKKFNSLLRAYKDQIGSRFSLFDYNPVKSLTQNTQYMNTAQKVNYSLPFASDEKALRAGLSIDNHTVANEQKNNYFLNDKASTFEVIEFNTADRKVIFINGNLIYFGDKRYNLGEIREANFSLIPGTGNANGVADNLGGLQDINNMLWNAFLDNIKLVLGPMFKVSGNIPIAKSGTLDFAKFRAFRTNGSADIEKIQLGVTDFAPINFMQVVQSFSEQRSGVSNYIMGGAGSIERVAGGIDMKFNQYKSKLTPITDSIDQMMGNIARSWITMFFKFFTKQELLKLGVDVQEKFETDEKTQKQKFTGFTINWIPMEDIINEQNVTFTYNSLYKLTKENSRAAVKEALPFILQYAGNKVNFDELMKVLLGQDFDPDNIAVKEQPKAPGAYAPSQDFKGSQAGGYSAGNAGGKYLPPVATEAPDDASYDNYGNQYDPNKYDSAYGQSNSYGNANAGPGTAPAGDDQALLDQLGNIS